MSVVSYARLSKSAVWAVKSFSTDSRARLAACRAARLHRPAAPVSAPLAARLRQAAHVCSVPKSMRLRRALPRRVGRAAAVGWVAWVGSGPLLGRTPRVATSEPAGTTRPSRFAVGFAEPCGAGRTRRRDKLARPRRGPEPWPPYRKNNGSTLDTIWRSLSFTEPDTSRLPRITN